MFRNLAFLTLIFLSEAALAQTPLRVKMFPGAQALPVMAAASLVETRSTTNSKALRNVNR